VGIFEIFCTKVPRKIYEDGTGYVSVINGGDKMGMTVRGSRASSDIKIDYG
jgi:hypothetical protein